jgi:hypothetical protein
MSTERHDLRPAPDLVEDGIPATVDDPPHLSTEAVEGEPAPLDFPQGVDEWGTTKAEERMGESVRRRAAREEPDVLDDLEADEEADEEAGTGVAGALSAEEAALHVEDEPEALGMSFAPDPGYVDDDDR